MPSVENSTQNNETKLQLEKQNSSISRSSAFIEKKDGTVKTSSKPASPIMSQQSSDLASPGSHLSKASKVSRIRITQSKNGKIGIVLETNNQNGGSSDSFETDSDFSSDRVLSGGRRRKKRAGAAS